MPFSHHDATPSPEHPFAEYVRILGKGKKGARPLTQDEARAAMGMILHGEVLPVQLGAFLMLMRIKEETPEELAGFAQAAQALFAIDAPGLVDLDWATYAGKRRHLPWFLLSARLLADHGISIFMHGATGHAADRLYTEQMLPYLGLSVAQSIDEARQQLVEHRFSYLGLQHFCAPLYDIIELRPILGLRSPVHTLVRLLNPFNAVHSIQGIFHPNYRPVHQQAAALLKQPHMAVLKGEGGETERSPDRDCLVQSVHNGELSDENWPAMFSHRYVKPEQLDPKYWLEVWQGQTEDAYAKASVIATAAVALKLLGKAETQDAAHALAAKYWAERNRY